jgi:hypothetical protein
MGRGVINDNALQRLLTRVGRRLTVEQADALERPVTLEEVKEAILAARNAGGTPGHDGLPPALYIKFAEELAPLLLEAFNWAITNGGFGEELTRSLIHFLLKSGKPREEWDSYRPISLLCCDIKIFARILQRRLTPLMSRLCTGPGGRVSQFAYVPGRRAAELMATLKGALRYANAEQKRFIFSVLGREARV